MPDSQYLYTAWLSDENDTEVVVYRLPPEVTGDSHAFMHVRSMTIHGDLPEGGLISRVVKPKRISGF